MPVNAVDAATLRRWLDDGSATLVDVREPAEYRACHIAEARPIPLGKIDIAHLPSSGHIVIHCLKGGRGASACEKLIRQNPALEVYNLAGGIDAWMTAGLPVRTGKFILPLDRQVQLTIGIFLLVVTGLSLVVSPMFVLAAGVIGLGLSTAGATGFCGLARLMACGPWNR